MKDQTATLTAAQTSYTFKNLPTHKPVDGKMAEIVYDVDEVSVAGYDTVKGALTAGKITITARSQWPATYAPAPDTLTIESIPYEGKTCYKEKPDPSRKNGNLKNPSPQENQGWAPMSEEEKRRTLQEVEQQQKDFGIQ